MLDRINPRTLIIRSEDGRANSGTLRQPIIAVDTFLHSRSSVPDEISANLTFNGSTGTTHTYDDFGRHLAIQRLRPSNLP